MKKLMALVLALLLLVALSGCQGGAEGGTAAQKAPDPLEPLTEGTYFGVFIVKSSPLIEYGQKALDNPESLPEVTGENAEQCEELDLNDEVVRGQVQEALDKGKSTLEKEVSLAIFIKKAEDGTLKSTVKIDFAAAFPEEECEPAKEEVYELVHAPGKLTMTATQEEEGEKLEIRFEGSILKDGILEGTFKMTTDNAEYAEYTKSDIIISGTWKATKDGND